jgi:hypothetical protein
MIPSMQYGQLGFGRTAAFLPGTTILLAHMDGTDGSAVFTDSSTYGRTMTRAFTAAIDTGQSVFGGASGEFPALGDYVAVTQSSDFDFTGVDFTMEGRIRLSHYSPGYSGSYEAMILSTWKASGNANGWQFGVYGTASTWDGITVYDGSSTFTFAQSLSLNTWYAVAISRSGSSLRAYVDGTQVGSTETSSGNYDGATELRIGNLDDAVYKKEFRGWMDELRIRRAGALYTGASYSVAGAAFTG